MLVAGALNEGREVNPGDTGLVAERRAGAARRSTKAERLIPATLVAAILVLRHVLRSTKAERLIPATPPVPSNSPAARSPAQRRPRG